MARAAPPGLIPAKMYRHFAIVTGALTFCLALFANGSNQNAISGQVSAQSNASQSKKAKTEEDAKKKSSKADSNTFVDNRTTRGSWGSDAGVGGFAGGFADDTASPELVAGGFGYDDEAGSGRSGPPAGMSMEEWLSEAIR